MYRMIHLYFISALIVIQVDIKCQSEYTWRKRNVIARSRCCNFNELIELLEENLSNEGEKIL